MLEQLQAMVIMPMAPTKRPSNHDYLTVHHVHADRKITVIAIVFNPFERFSEVSDSVESSTCLASCRT